MKTSNKLIFAASLLLVISLFAFDYMTRLEYFSGRYKNPYKDFATLKLKDFDAVDVNSTSAANVKFIQGPFRVMVDTNALNFVRITQQGDRLQINVAFEHSYVYNPHPYLVVISCPRLSEVSVNAIFTAGNKKIVDTVYREDWSMRQNLIEGFKEDSLSIRQTYGGSIVFSGNHIKFLNAVAGSDVGSGSRIIILKNNTFQNATLDILNRSKLLLDGESIQNLKYHLADSARMTITGASQNILKNSKSYQK
jgi:hypothetical protein